MFRFKNKCVCGGRGGVGRGGGGGGRGGGGGGSGRTRVVAMRQQTKDQRMRTCLEQMLTPLALKEETKGITPSQRQKKKKREKKV